MGHAPRKFNRELAVVTGASRGIGAAIASRLVHQGYSVVLLARQSAPLAKLTHELAKGSDLVRGIACDVSRKQSVEKAFSAIERELGVPGIIVNNAGVGGPFHRVDEVSDREWRAIFATNLDSVFYTSRIVLPKMKREGFGRIVNIASIQGLFGGAWSSTYVATKHAMVGYTKAIAAEWGAYGITCNAVCPGYIDTRMTENRSRRVSGSEALQRIIPARRLGLPAEVAATVFHLVGPDGGYLNGGSFVIDGGLTAQLGASPA